MPRILMTKTAPTQPMGNADKKIFDNKNNKKID